MEKMLAEKIKNQIVALMSSKGIDSFAELERIAGLKKNAVWNICSGRTNNPGIDNLIAIAKVLDCTIDQLVSFNHFSSESLDNKIANQIFDHLTKYLDSRDIELNLDKFWELFQEIYFFFTKNNNGIVTNGFIEWLVDKNYPQSMSKVIEELTTEV
ncbi:MAG: helix-turn-helix transcriptional regulator [Pseudomonadota bacterium]